MQLAITIEQASQILDMSPAKVRRYVHDEILSRVGGTKRMKVSLYSVLLAVGIPAQEATAICESRLDRVFHNGSSSPGIWSIF